MTHTLTVDCQKLV